MSRKRFKQTKALQLIGLGVLALATLAVVVAAMLPSMTKPEAAPTPPRPSATQTAAPKPVVAFIGDSYTQAGGPNSYAYQVAKTLDMAPVLDGVGGTGYTKANGEYKAIPDRVNGFLSAQGDVSTVVFAAGLNDDPATDVAGAAAQAWADAAKLKPSAKLVVIGPFYPGDPNGNVQLVRDELKAQAEAAGLPFIDPIAEKWFTGSKARGTGNAATYIGDDNTHPNDAGQQYLAEKITAALRAVGV